MCEHSFIVNKLEHAQSGPSSTDINMSGRGSLYRDSLPPCGQTDTTENITSATPLAGGINRNLLSELIVPRYTCSICTGSPVHHHIAVMQATQAPFPVEAGGGGGRRMRMEELGIVSVDHWGVGE